MSLLSRRTVLTAALGGFAGVGLWRARSVFLSPNASEMPGVTPADGEMATFVRTSRALGTNVSITIAHAEASIADAAATAAFAELERVEQCLSVYRADSELGRLNREQVLRSADERFRVVLSMSLAMSRMTDGAFDVTVQPLWDLHARAAKEGRSPTSTEIAAARQRIGWQSVELAGADVRFAQPDMAITFNGIGQGYATDRVKHVLLEQGIRHALIDIGELTAIGQKSAGRAWQAGIQHPRVADAYAAIAKLEGRSLATSGDYATTFLPTVNGAGGDHHIFDPATGHSPTELASVSVVAPTAMQADALSTALFVMGPERGRELVAASAGVDALFVLKDGTAAQTADFPLVNQSGES